MTEQYRKFMQSKWTIAASGLLLGILLVLGIRFATYYPEEVHYHANFAVYLNGQREEFKGQKYYEEVEMCSESGAMSPAKRAHMHDNVNSVVHVEDHAVTWGQFFANLGWTMSGDSIENADGTIYASSGETKSHLILNGQDYTGLGLANTVIKDRDRLLVSFGDEDGNTLQQEYKTVPNTANHYDATKDPALCSGAESPSIQTRLQHLF